LSTLNLTNIRTESDSSTDFFLFNQPISPNKLNKTLGIRSTSPSVQTRQEKFKMSTKRNNIKSEITTSELDAMIASTAGEL